MDCCLCLYWPQQWKATVLLTVKVCDGPSSEKGPLCPSFCAYVRTGGWGGGGVGGCIFGSDSEVLTVKHSSKPGPLPSSGNACVPTTAVWITQPHTHAYLSFMKYGGKKKKPAMRSHLLAFLGNLQNKGNRISFWIQLLMFKKKNKNQTKRKLCLCERSLESYSGKHDNPDQASLFFSRRLKPFPGQTSSASQIWTDPAVSVLANIRLQHQSRIHDLYIWKHTWFPCIHHMIRFF